MEAIRSFSSYTKQVRFDLDFDFPAARLLTWGQICERLATDTHGVYLDDGMEDDHAPRLFEDDIDWEGSDARSAVEEMDYLLGTEFALVPTDEIPDDTAKALNAHIVTAISTNLKEKVDKCSTLILCAGDGEDVCRLAHCDPNLGYEVDLVGATSLSQRAKYILSNSGADVRVTGKWLHELPKSWFKEYDRIICHHGLHHVLSTPAGVSAFQWLLSRLTPTGIFMGDKVDPMGLDTLHGFSFNPSHGIEFASYDPGAGIEGEVYMRINGKLWRDPILSDQRLHNLMPIGFMLNMYQGRGAFYSRNSRGLVLEPPPSVRSAAQRSETRIISYIEIVRMNGFAEPLESLEAPVPPNVPAPGQPWCDPLVWERRPSVAGWVLSNLEFPVNKGLHFSVRDVPYLEYGSTIFAEKSDGLSARVYIGEGGAYARVDGYSGAEFYFSPVPNRVGLPPLRLQCEYMPDGSFVVLDPVHLGPYTPTGFLSRLTYLESILHQTPQLRYLLRGKEWRSYFHPDHYKDKEGVVLMGVATPSPASGAKYCRTARYSKWRPTVDVLGPEGIVEVLARDRSVVIRRRPDKTAPNSEANIKAVVDSMTPGDLFTVTSIKYDPKCEAKALSRMSHTRQIVPDPGLCVALRYPNRLPLDPHLRALKFAFLGEMGFAPPANYNPVYRGEAPGTFDNLPSWEVDWGQFDFGQPKPLVSGIPPYVGKPNYDHPNPSAFPGRRTPGTVDAYNDTTEYSDDIALPETWEGTTGDHLGPGGDPLDWYLRRESVLSMLDLSE